MEKELYDIKNGIIDKIILITAIASLPVNIASLLPYYEIGCQNICFFHVSLPVFFFGLLALKNKLNFYLKTHSLSVVFLLIGILGKIYFGFAGAFYYSFLPILLSGILLKKKQAIIYLVSVIGLLVSVGILNGFGYLSPKVDFVNSQLLSILWIAFLATIIHFTLIVYIVAREFLAYLIKTVGEKNCAIEHGKNQENLLQHIIDNIPGLVFIKDENGVYKFANKIFRKVFNIEGPIKGQNDYDLFDKEYAQKISLDDKRTINENKNEQVEENFYIDNKEYTYLTNKTIIKNEWNKNDLLGVALDVTEKKEIERELISSKEKYELLFKDLPIGAYRTAFCGNILEVNEKAANIFGFDSPLEMKEAIKNITSDLYENPEDRGEILQSILDSGYSRTDTLLKRKDGSTFYACLIVRTITESNGTKILAGTVENIDARKDAEQKLKESRKQLQQIFDYSPAIMILLDENLELININRSGLEFVGQDFDRIKKNKPGELLNCINSILHEDGCGHSVNCKTCIIRKKSLETLNNKKACYKKEVQLITYKNNKQEEFTFFMSTYPIVDKKTTLLLTLENITELKEVQKVYDQAQRRYRELFEFSRDGFIIVSTDGSFISANPSYCKLVGYTLEELQTKGDSLNITPLEWRLWEQKEIESKLLKEKGYSGIYEKEYVRKNGEVFPIEIQKFTVKGPDGKTDYIWGIVRDITERKRAETALFESEKRISMALQNSNEGIWDWNLKDDLWFYSPTYYTMVGYEPYEFREEFNEWKKRVHPEDRIKVLPLLNDYLDGKSTDYMIEFRFMTKKDGYKWLRSKGKIVERDEKGKPKRIIGTHTDINIEKKALIALEESDSRLKTAQRMAKIGYWHMDIVKNELEWSDEVYRIFDMEPGEFNATYDAFLKYIHPDDRAMVDSTYQNSLINKRPYEIEHRLLTKMRNLKYVKEKCDTEFDKKGNPVRSIGTIQDITEIKRVRLELEQYHKHLETIVRKRTEELNASNEELKTANEELQYKNEKIGEQKKKLEKALDDLKKAQSQLIQAEKMASIGVLSAGIAHEINNPINYISGGMAALRKKHNLLLYTIGKYREILRSDEQDKIEKINELVDEQKLLQLINKTKRMMNNIQTGIDQTIGIVNSLKTFTDSQQSTFILSDVNQIIENALIILRNKYKNRIKIIKELGDVPKIECIKSKVSQVIMNLTLNAIQAIEEEGMITITTKIKTNKYIEVSIMDTGCGIPEKYRAQIFDPFFTSKSVGKGTGLGLYLVYTIIEQHKGQIDYTSEVGVGTTFTILLPIKAEN